MEAWAEVWVERSEGGGRSQLDVTETRPRKLGAVVFLSSMANYSKASRYISLGLSPSITLSRSCRSGPVEDVVF